MKLLEDRIRKDGKMLPGDILKIDNFLNHQIDTRLMDQIGEKIEEILSTPRYKGIEKIGSGTLSLMILAECRQQDYRRVSRLLNRELYDLCKENDIELM